MLLQNVYGILNRLYLILHYKIVKSHSCLNFMLNYLMIFIPLVVAFFSILYTSIFFTTTVRTACVICVNLC